MCGESWLANHPRSQGWASRCPLIYTFVCLGYGRVGYLTFLFYMFIYCAMHMYSMYIYCYTGSIRLNIM